MIKALETSGIQPDVVVGTSAGAVVGSLYAAGHGPFELQKLAIQLDESAVTDWSLFDRGFIKGEALERFINTHAGNRPIEGLRRRFAAVATDLQSGEVIIFQRGNTGIAVRASAAIPGVFPPVAVNGREYVDGGLVAPIPVREARSLGADLVIAVDISGRPSGKKNQGSVDVLLDTISIMGGALGKVELAAADVVIRPDLKGLPAWAAAANATDKGAADPLYALAYDAFLYGYPLVHLGRWRDFRMTQGDPVAKAKFRWGAWTHRTQTVHAQSPGAPDHGRQSPA